MSADLPALTILEDRGLVITGCEDGLYKRLQVWQLLMTRTWAGGTMVKS